MEYGLSGNSTFSFHVLANNLNSLFLYESLILCVLDAKT